MKKFLKKLLCISLAMLMVMFCFIGCGEDTTANDDPEYSKAEEKNPGSSTAAGENIAVGFEIKDINSLLALFGVTDESLDIENIKLDLTANKNGNFVYALGAKLFGEEENLKLFGGENLVIASTLLDKAYGIDDVTAFASKLIELVYDYDVDLNKPATRYEGDSNQATTATGQSLLLKLLTSPKFKTFAEKYYNKLIVELKTNGGLSVSEANGITTLSGKLSTDAMATIIVNIVEELCADADFYEITGIDKSDFLEGKPEKSVLLSQFKQGLSEFGIDVTVTKLAIDAENAIKSFDVTVKTTEPIGNYTIKIALDVDTKTFSIDLSDGQGNYIKASLSPDKITADINSDITDTEGDGSVFTTTTKGKLNIDENGVFVDFDFTDINDYSYWDGIKEYCKTVCTLDCELTASKLTFKYEMQDDRKVTGDENYSVSDGEIIELNATYSDKGGEAAFKVSEISTDTRYPEYDYSDVEEWNAKLTIGDTETKLEITAEEQTMVITLTDSESTLTGTLDVDGEELGNIKLGKKTEGSKTTYTLNSISAEGETVDFSGVGISFYIDTNAKMESAPSYTSIDNMTAEELSEILEGIENNNRDLFEKLDNLFTSGSYDASQETVRYPEYYD